MVIKLRRTSALSRHDDMREAVRAQELGAATSAPQAISRRQEGRYVARFESCKAERATALGRRTISRARRRPGGGLQKRPNRGQTETAGSCSVTAGSCSVTEGGWAAGCGGAAAGVGPFAAEAGVAAHAQREQRLPAAAPSVRARNAAAKAVCTIGVHRTSSRLKSSDLGSVAVARFCCNSFLCGILLAEADSTCPPPTWPMRCTRPPLVIVFCLALRGLAVTRTGLVSIWVGRAVAGAVGTAESD